MQGIKIGQEEIGRKINIDWKCAENRII